MPDQAEGGQCAQRNFGKYMGEKRKPLPDTEWRSRIILGVAWLVCVLFFPPTVSKLINNDLEPNIPGVVFTL